MLGEAGLDRSQCYLTNVFNLRPKANDLLDLCGPDRSLGLPPLAKGKHLRPEFLPELDRLYRELRDTRPNIAILLGATACWALLHTSGIKSIRGTVTASRVLPTLKVLPTFHPAAILRDWSLRPVTVLDLAKARRESEFPEVRRPERTVWIEPSLADLEAYLDRYLIPAKRIAFDIETAGSQITCIGFAPDPGSALVVPFTDPRRTGGSYWGDAGSEAQAWRFVNRVLGLPQPKTAQNGLYDVHFLWRSYGIAVRNFEHDTMLLSHALQPESPKGLGFLASVWTNESSWKLLRTRGKTTIKRDE